MRIPGPSNGRVRHARYHHGVTGHPGSLAQTGIAVPGPFPGSTRETPRTAPARHPCPAGIAGRNRSAMTTTTSPAPPAGTVHALARPGLVLLAVTGALTIAVLRAVLPYSTADDPTGIAAAAAGHPFAQSAVLWLGYLALLTLPIGVLIVARVAAATRPVLGRVAAVLSWAGFTSLFWLTATDQLAMAGAATGIRPPVVAELIAGVDTLPVSTVAAAVFVVGHIVGTVLLGLASWRVLPRWIAVGLVVSQPLHLVFAVVLPNPWLDALAWGLTALGFGFTAHVSAMPPGGVR